VREEDIPQAELDREADVARARAHEEGKPEAILPRIVEGRLAKYKEEVVLLRQPYIRDETLNVEKLLHQAVGSIGENIIIRRFARWELGENTKS
jgi:elongation factor Ts